MTVTRTTLPAEADDLMVLKQEARRRGVSLGSLLAEIVGREAAAIRASRRPRFGVVDRPAGIAAAMDEDPDAPLRTEYQSQ
jgi:hypothetical protein